MKKYFLASLMILTSAAASAACFQFNNGEGPDRIGNYSFGAKAQVVCVETVQSFGGDPYTSIRLSDRQGDLAQMAGTLSGSTVQLSSGNIQGENVDLTGAEISLSVQADSHLGISSGSLTVKAGRDFPQSYLIIKADR